MRNSTRAQETPGQTPEWTDTTGDLMAHIASFVEAGWASHYTREINFLLCSYYSHMHQEEERMAEAGIDSSLDTRGVADQVYRITSLHDFIVGLHELWHRHTHLHPDKAREAMERRKL